MQSGNLAGKRVWAVYALPVQGFSAHYGYGRCHTLRGHLLLEGCYAYLWELEKAIGQDVYNKVNPSQMIVKIVHDEIQELLGEENAGINFAKGLTTIMLVGLQGTVKTTSAGKLAYQFTHKLNKKTMVAALDVYRPGAIEQLETVVANAGANFFSMGNKENPVNIAKAAQRKAMEEGMDVLILDTAGRLQIDEGLMDELKKILN